MKAKKEAEQLFDKINIHIPINASFKDSAEEAIWKMEKDHLATKKIALIAINRNIEMLTNLVNRMDDFSSESRNVIWKLIEDEQEVKQEIEKL